MLNRLEIIGNVGKDPEYNDERTPRLKFTVAVNEKYGDKETTEWFNVVIWGEFAKTMSRHLTKGQLVYVAGPLNSFDYEKDGQKQRWWELKGETLRMLGGGKDREERWDDRRDDRREERRDDRRDDRREERRDDRGRSGGNPFGGRRG